MLYNYKMKRTTKLPLKIASEFTHNPFIPILVPLNSLLKQEKTASILLLIYTILLKLRLNTKITTIKIAQSIKALAQ